MITEQVRIDEVRKQGEIAVQEAEIQRREKELIATVLRSAEIERKRIETLAEADRERQVLHATGQAEATRLDGQAVAEVTRIQGLAEAEVIRAKGEAEANAMRVRVRAMAYQEYNQAAVIDKLVGSMPEMVRAVAEPLTKVDKITVVSTGGEGHGAGAGVNRITADIGTMVAQVPALFEGLTGMKVADLMKEVPQLGAAGKNGNGHRPAPAEGDGASPPEPDGTLVAGGPAVVDGAP